MAAPAAIDRQCKNILLNFYIESIAKFIFSISNRLLFHSQRLYCLCQSLCPVAAAFRDAAAVRQCTQLYICTYLSTRLHYCIFSESSICSPSLFRSSIFDCMPSLPLSFPCSLLCYVTYRLLDQVPINESDALRGRIITPSIHQTFPETFLCTTTIRPKPELCHVE